MQSDPRSISQPKMKLEEGCDSFKIWNDSSPMALARLPFRNHISSGRDENNWNAVTFTCVMIPYDSRNAAHSLIQGCDQSCTLPWSPSIEAAVEASTSLPFTASSMHDSWSPALGAGTARSYMRIQDFISPRRQDTLLSRAS